MGTLLQSIQFAIATGVLIFGLIQLVNKNPGPINYCMFTAIFSLSYILLYFWAIDSNFLYSMPLLVNTDIPFTFFSGASLYQVFITLFNEREQPKENFKRHFIIPTLLLTACIVLNITMLIVTGAVMKPEIMTRNEKGSVWIHVIAIISELVFFSYIFFALIEGVRAWKKKIPTNKKQFIFMFLFLLCVQIIALLFIAVRFIKNTMLAQNLTFVCGFLTIIFCLLGFRYPEYTQRVLKTKKAQNKRALHLQNHNTDALMVRLISLMENDKIYTLPELTLKDVGKFMKVPSETVSQLINRKTHMNFKAFINKYRIEAICRQLCERPDTAIIEIAFDNGFNSKSTFNSAFQEITGKTPSEFRKKSTLQEKSNAIR